MEEIKNKMNLNDYTEFIYSAIENVDIIKLNYITNKIYNCGGTIFTAGNGGSGSSASHFTQDLVKKCKISSVCLNDNVGLITAITNDSYFSKVFSDQLSVLGRSGDILFLISGSGKSGDLLYAAEQASTLGMDVFALVGMTGGDLKMCADSTIHVPINGMGMSEAAHSIILHYIIDIINMESEEGDVNI
jgi:D-sedoheptulose 7-phosphate isomerase